MKSAYIGTSAAISWAWGTSFIIGMTIAQTKGFDAFLMWAIANSITLGIFGLLYKSDFLNIKILDNVIVKIVTTIIQFYSLVIQTKILNEVLCRTFSSEVSYCITVGFCIALILWMYWRGLLASIFTDLFQGIGTLVICVGIVGYCLLGFAGPATFTPTTDSSAYLWAAWSACILLSGIITDIQHWQRVEYSKEVGAKYSYEFATAFFFVYVACIYAASMYKFDSVLNWMLLGVIVCTTTSTVDSVAVALHRTFGRNIATILACIMVFGFTLLLNTPLLTFWAYFGTIRVALCVFMLCMCGYWVYCNKQHSIK